MPTTAPHESDDFDWIATPEALTAWAHSIDNPSSLALDTEFERSKTYFAELCLIQVAWRGRVALIDPVSVESLDPLQRCTAGASLLIHACRQDLEVLHGCGINLGTSVIDTQIAAALVGMPDQIGYADLVRELLDIELDKSQTRTDWRKRPLTAAQLTYAADDVRHLEAVHEALMARLAEHGRAAWLEEECARLTTPARWLPEPANAWSRVKGIGALDEAAFGRAVALAAWRETAAVDSNRPRNWLLRDPELLRIASDNPSDMRQLATILSEQPRTVRKSGREILECTAAAGSGAPLPPRPRPLLAPDRALLKQTSARIRAVAEELGIAANLLATRKDLEATLRGAPPPHLLSGWRQPLVGDIVRAVRGDA